MSEFDFFNVMRQGLWSAFIISFPILIAALITGVLIGLFQALTSIQEMTLAFVPKLAALLVVFWFSMDFMTAELVSLFQDRILPIVVSG